MVAAVPHLAGIALGMQWPACRCFTGHGLLRCTGVHYGGQVGLLHCQQAVAAWGTDIDLWRRSSCYGFCLQWQIVKLHASFSISVSQLGVRAPGQQMLRGRAGL